MNDNKAIVWFRQDLRLHDNEALVEAIAHNDGIVAVYVFDTRMFKTLDNFGFAKTDGHRAQFIIESVQALRDSLSKFDIDLIVRVGKPEEEIYKIARRLKTKWVYCNRERTSEEVKVQDALEESLWSIGQEIRYSRGKMLYYTQDLPFPITHTPDSFKQFQKEVGRFIQIREPLETPSSIPSFKHFLDKGKIPSLKELGLTPNKKETQHDIEFIGGEQNGLRRLSEFLSSSQLHDCSFFSPWLSQGCLSPKTIYHQIQNSPKKEAIISHLMLRDFYRLMGKKHLNSIFKKGGIIQNHDKPFSTDRVAFDQWTKGETDEPIVNAFMKQLEATGYISAIGRKITANYLSNTLKIDWRMGAAYFESKLIDYDPCSNWVNWNEMAGLTPSSRQYRFPNYIQLFKKEHTCDDFLQKWLPNYQYGS